MLKGIPLLIKKQSIFKEDQFHSVALPYHCFNRGYSRKDQTMLAAEITVATMAIDEQTDNTINYLEGTVTSAEGLYYIESYFQFSDTDTLPNTFDCNFDRTIRDGPSKHYRRYQYNTKVKIIVDDPDVVDIKTSENIPD